MTAGNPFYTLSDEVLAIDRERLRIEAVQREERRKFFMALLAEKGIHPDAEFTQIWSGSRPDYFRWDGGLSVQESFAWERRDDGADYQTELSYTPIRKDGQRHQGREMFSMTVYWLLAGLADGSIVRGIQP